MFIPKKRRRCHLRSAWCSDKAARAVRIVIDGQPVDTFACRECKKAASGIYRHNGKVRNRAAAATEIPEDIRDAYEMLTGEYGMSGPDALEYINRVREESRLVPAHTIDILIDRSSVRIIDFTDLPSNRRNNPFSKKQS